MPSKYPCSSNKTTYMKRSVNFSLNFNTICNTCGQLVKAGDKCSCKRRKTDSQKKHPSGTWEFQKLRKRVIDRDAGHCQRCRIKFGLMNFDDLQCHHIKSWRDYPDLAYDELNLITICRHCNLDLGNSNKLDFFWETPEEISYFL
ncbi:HNH endonuclease [Bacillus anthracis]|uniref:HNH endonuclease n=2 Tax=Bacillus anthracis TaxID=1392 RepID=UPI0001633E28|nr:HNH endonuclease signature motif containing protein [Bacillus anthracis]AFH86493.1 Hypothetical Protein H9401_5107 [Bacillus anthracis str. H9401]AIM08995.1 hypothetical protein BACvac02_5498 [Bacillus anthracis]EDR19780.1 conserved domain protein [Bacillus anthracis str. A0488]